MEDALFHLNWTTIAYNFIVKYSLNIATLLFTDNLVTGIHID